MTPIQLEALTLRTVDQVRAAQPVEDAQIELKRVLPADPYKAARRIGGHANASRGQPVVWIIGLDEDEGVTGADKAELSDWWPQVQRYFDDVQPELLLQPMNVPVEGDDGERLTVVALAFDTSRLPFVVTAKGQAGPIQREVPYRDATGLRSAKRGDLIRLLAPPTPRVDVEVLGARVEGSLAADRAGQKPETFTWKARCRLYFTTHGDGRTVYPDQALSAHLTYRGEDYPIPMHVVQNVEGLHVSVSDGNIVLNGPGALMLNGTASLPCLASREVDRVTLTVTMHALRADDPLRALAVLSDRSERRPDRYPIGNVHRPPLIIWQAGQI